MCKHVLKKLPYLLRYVPDKYNTQQICDKAILENAGTLKYVPDCSKNQEMCNKAVENYPQTLEYVSECYKTQKMCDKAVDTFPSTIKFVPGCCKSKEICHRTVQDAFLYLILFLINIKLKKYVTCLFLYIFHSLYIVLINM